MCLGSELLTNTRCPLAGVYVSTAVVLLAIFIVRWSTSLLGGALLNRLHHRYQTKVTQLSIYSQGKVIFKAGYSD